jgi:hypothetical protein
MKNFFLVSSNLFIPSVLISILLSDIHFVPGHREVELLILALIAFKLIAGRNISLLFPKSFHEHLFLFLIIYICINIIMSILVNGVSFHWLLYFLMFLPLASEAKNIERWEIQKKLKSINLIVNFLLIYVIFGLASRVIDFSSTPIDVTMLLIPISAFMPFVIFNVKYGSQKNRIIAYIIIILCLFQILLESSRGALIIYFVTICFGFWAIGFSRRALKDIFLLSPLIVFSIFFILVSIDVTSIVNDTILVFGGTAESGALKDIDRFLNYAAMIQFFEKSSLGTMLFGTGFRSAWIHASPYLTNLYDILLPNLDYSKDETIIGIPGIIINIGIIGTLLLIFTFLSSIFFSTKDLDYKWRFFLAISILGVFARNFGNDITTNAILMFVIMPYGIYWFLASCIKDKKKINNL